MQTRRHSRRRAPTAPRARTALALVLATLGAGAAQAFDELNAAQRLIYARPHLAATRAGDTIEYRYRERVGERAALEDRVRVEITAADGAERRDVALDFLSGERRMALPPFTAYRGNPVLIAALEHFVRTFAREADGSALYFRNRVRDALASDAVEIREGEREVGGHRVPTTTIDFTPFADDPYVGARPGFGDARFRLVLSEAVPGGVVLVAAESDAAGAAYSRELRVDGAEER